MILPFFEGSLIQYIESQKLAVTIFGMTINSTFRLKTVFLV